MKKCIIIILVLLFVVGTMVGAIISLWARILQIQKQFDDYKRSTWISRGDKSV